MASEIVPALALGAGVVGTWAASGWRERSTGRREEAARDAERQVARDAFQRETLLELQEAMLALIRSAALVRLKRVIVYRDTGRYGRDPDGEELSQSNLDANGRVSRLQQRVLDDDLRAHIRRVHEMCSRLIELPAPELDDADLARETQRTSIELAHAFRALEEHIGRVLRDLL